MADRVSHGENAGVEFLPVEAVLIRLGNRDRFDSKLPETLRQQASRGLRQVKQGNLRVYFAEDVRRNGGGGGAAKCLFHESQGMNSLKAHSDGQFGGWLGFEGPRRTVAGGHGPY